MGDDQKRKPAFLPVSHHGIEGALPIGFFSLVFMFLEPDNISISQTSQKQRKPEPEKVIRSKTRRENEGVYLYLEDSQGHRLGGRGGQGESEGKLAQ